MNGQDCIRLTISGASKEATKRTKRQLMEREKVFANHRVIKGGYPRRNTKRPPITQ